MSSKSQNNNALEVVRAVKAVLAGRVDAYDVIYERCNGRLRAFVGSRFRQFGDDFVSEVAIRTHERALSRLREFDAGRSAFPTWLCWQARSVAAQVRKEWYDSRRESFNEARHGAAAPAVPGPEERREEVERSRLLWDEYEALEREGRLSIALYDLEDRTFAAAAQASGMSRWRVQRARSRALARLRERLRRQGFGAWTATCSRTRPHIPGRQHV